MLLNLIRALAWVIVVFFTTCFLILSDSLIAAIVGFVLAYLVVMTLADVVDQKLIEKFDSES